MSLFFLVLQLVHIVDRRLETLNDDALLLSIVPERRMHALLREEALTTPDSDSVPLRIAKQAITCESSAYLGPDGFTLIRAAREAVPRALPMRFRSAAAAFCPALRNTIFCSCRRTGRSMATSAYSSATGLPLSD